MKNIFLGLFLFICIPPDLALAQHQLPIKATCQYLRKGDSDNIKLTLTNSSNRTFYYGISLWALADTGWVGLLANINALGLKEFLKLIPIKAGQRVIKIVPKSKVFSFYPRYANKKLRFEVEYHERPELRSDYKIIYLPPI